MKQDTFFLTRWWNGKNLQSRLAFVFTILFVLCFLTLSIFLLNLVQLVQLNEQARTIYEQTRQVYRLEAMIKQYQLGLKNYEISSSSLAQEELTATGRSIDETIQSLKVGASAAHASTLDDLADQKNNLTSLVTRIIDAVDLEDSKDYEEQDWTRVEQLDAQAAGLFDEMIADTSLVSSDLAGQLQDVQGNAEMFSLYALFSGLLALPMFFFLALLAALINTLQINLPLERLAQAVKDLQERKLNPSDMEGLTRRTDEIGIMAREFLLMAEDLGQRDARLAAEVEEIRSKIK